MCIIIAHEGPKKIAPVTEDVLDICYHNHPHGFGIAWLEDGTVHAMHTLDEKEIRKKYYEVCKIPKTSVILHYRRKTHGEVTLENCHPFKIHDNLWFAHNKTIHRCKPGPKDTHDKSDTRLFNEEILQKLPKGFHRNKAIVRLIEPFIDNSRIALLDPEGIVYWNKWKGVTVGNTWYSNDSYKAREYKPENGYPYGNPNYGWGWNNQYDDDAGRLPYKAALYIKKMANPPEDLTGKEYVVDNLLCRWDRQRRENVAWDSQQARWRVYNNVLGRFETEPYTTPEHIPALYKGFRPVWERMTSKQIRCACCDALQPQGDMVNDCPLFEGAWVCQECAKFFIEHEEIA